MELNLPERLFHDKPILHESGIRLDYIHSNSDDAIRERVENWADSVPELA